MFQFQSALRIESYTPKPLPIVNLKRLIGDKKHDHVGFGRSSVFHYLPFGEPDEVAGAKLPGVGDECSFQHIHAVGAGVRVGLVDHAGRVFDDADLHAGVGVGDQILAIERFVQGFVEARFPGFGVDVDGDEGRIHCLILAWFDFAWLDG